MSSASPSDENTIEISIAGIIAIWALTVLVIQTFLWLTTWILEDADIIGGRLEWLQSGILAISYVFVRTWLLALRMRRTS